MTHPAIEIKDLGKRYKLGLTHAGSVRELVNRVASRLVGKGKQTMSTQTLDPSRLDDEGMFWAVKDVNLEIPSGEAIGIIGRNGAGKSTLLKILSRITKPTSGRIKLYGRVASLLEVGTGFHPELTGRENVFLNGTILGMTRADISKRFDDIVSFAGVEKFIDTPVKRYSSGMTVRLGFAVAAHLEPEILIVDEVLAVGDLDFQKRCLGKMNQVANSGRTVLFVSHNLSSVRSLTSKCAWMSNGKLEFYGDTSAAIHRYVYANQPTAGRVVDLSSLERSASNLPRSIEMTRIEMLSQSEDIFADNALPFKLGIHRNDDELRDLAVGITVFRDDGEPVGTSFSQRIELLADVTDQSVELQLPTSLLAPGSYLCAISVGLPPLAATRNVYDSVSEVLHFQVTEGKLSSQYNATRWVPGWGRICLPDIEINSKPKAMPLYV